MNKIQCDNVIPRPFSASNKSFPSQRHDFKLQTVPQMEPIPTANLDKRQRMSPSPRSPTSRLLSTPSPTSYLPTPTSMPTTSTSIPGSYIIGFAVAMFVIVGVLAYFIYRMIQRRQNPGPARPSYIQHQESSNYAPSSPSDASPTPLISPVYPPSSPTYTAYAFGSQMAQPQEVSPHYRTTTTSSHRSSHLAPQSSVFDSIPAPPPPVTTTRNRAEEPPPPYTEQ